MTTTTHTRGPWEVCTGITGTRPLEGKTSEGRPAAWVQGRDYTFAQASGETAEEALANAALIAAAPDLAEALRLALDTIASLHGHYCPDCKGGCPDLETIAIGRAAIAKAEGL